MVAHALRFAIASLILPAAVLGGIHGGGWLALPFAVGWLVLPALDLLAGRCAKGLAVSHRSNPFWRHGLGALERVAAALLLGGPAGLAILLLWAAHAVFQLEAVNDVELCGMVRDDAGDGRFERAKPRHSWTASERVSTWNLINLQRHSEHHDRPDRRLPLLQQHAETEAPQLPAGYPVMIPLALIPPIWVRIMDPAAARCRTRFYPQITGWTRSETGAIGAPG